jgi:hypothetical protein
MLPFLFFYHLDAFSTLVRDFDCLQVVACSVSGVWVGHGVGNALDPGMEQIYPAFSCLFFGLPSFKFHVCVVVVYACNVFLFLPLVCVSTWPLNPLLGCPGHGEDS